MDGRGVMKDKVFTCFKNVCQVFVNILEGWLAFWWLGFAYVGITDRKDRESIEVAVPIGWTMVVIGVIVIFSIELIMYRWNKNCKKYLLFSLLPSISTALAAFLYVFFR